MGSRLSTMGSELARMENCIALVTEFGIICVWHFLFTLVSGGTCVGKYPWMVSVTSFSRELAYVCAIDEGFVT